MIFSISPPDSSPPQRGISPCSDLLKLLVLLLGIALMGVHARARVLLSSRGAGYEGLGVGEGCLCVNQWRVPV